MPKLTSAVPVFLSEPYVEALRRWADELGLKEAEAAARLLEDGLEPYLQDGDAAARVASERQLLSLAEALTQEELSSPDWNEHLALSVFERIRKEHLELYRAATAAGYRDSVNRRVGRHIKTAAGAEVKTAADGKTITAKVSRGSPALISRYTLLTRGLSRG